MKLTKFSVEESLKDGLFANYKRDVRMSGPK